jgi:hypothetical protein
VSPFRIPLTERQKNAMRALLMKIGSMSNARYDQWLRYDVGDEDANAIIAWLRSRELDPYDGNPLKTIGTQETTSASQFERAHRARAVILGCFPQLAEAKDELARALDDAQNGPPDAAADGSIGEVAWKQFSYVRKHLETLLLSLLFEPERRQ